METTIMGLYRDYRLYFWGGSNGIMENNMENYHNGVI